MSTSNRSSICWLAAVGPWREGGQSRSERPGQAAIGSRDQHQGYLSGRLQRPRLFDGVLVAGGVFALGHLIGEFCWLPESRLAGTDGLLKQRQHYFNYILKKNLKNHN